MPLELKIVSEHADLVGDDAIREFSEAGGTIGRSLQNDWILPDPDRYISGRHATIDHKGGIYYLLDTSSNGVYVNNELEPIGRGNPRRLFNGDRLRMGDFLFSVSLDSGESLVMPLDPDARRAPDNDVQLVDEVSLRTGVKLLDEDELAGDDVFQSALFGAPAPEPEVDTPTEVSLDEPEPTPAAAERAAVDSSADDLFDSFLDGIGISPSELHPSVSRTEIMLTAGKILRESIAGLTTLLAGRANLKHTFRLDQTTVLPRHNNPLKLAENATDLIKQLLVGNEGDYLKAEDAIREVCRDLEHHQNAFLDAMSSAFVEFADRFDPDELQEGFDHNGGGGKLFGLLKNQNYWQAYRDLYPILTDKGSARFPQMFGEEFVRAYERHVAEYKRQDHEGHTGSMRPLVDQQDDPGLMETQKLDPPLPYGAVRPAAENTASVSESGALEIDQSFLDELDNSISEDDIRDQLNG